MEDKIILKIKTKNILNFYEIEPWCCISYWLLLIYCYLEAYLSTVTMLLVSS